MKPRIAIQSITRRDFLQASLMLGSLSPLHVYAGTRGTPTAGGTFKAARSASFKDFSGVWFAAGTYPFSRALYNTLVRFDDKQNPQPELAESWQFSPDGLALTLTLRQGVRFHSGREFTSEDVKFSVDYGKDIKVASQMRQAYEMIKEVRAQDKYTVQLLFDKPNALVFDALDTMGIHDRSVIDNIARVDAGSGPFKVVSYTPNYEVRMKRFEGYWVPGRPYVDEYIVLQVPDEAALVINLESKAIDAVWGPPLHEVARLKSQPSYVADAPYGASAMFHVAANVRNAPISNKKVRQAINYAIDRARFCRTILSGMVEPTCLMWPKTSWAYFADLEGKYTYDLGKAKQLLTEAGYPSGFEIKILTSKQLTLPLLGLAQILQADLAKIGIRAQILDQETGVYTNNLRRGQGWDLACHTYHRANHDPGTMLSGAVAWYPKSAGTSPTGFENEDFVRWRNEAASTLDREKRKLLYRKIQELVLDECFSMAVAGDQVFWVHANYVKGLQYTRQSSAIVDDLWLDK